MEKDRHPTAVPQVRVEYLTEAQLTTMQDDFEKVIADYQVSSNERIMHITNETLMLVTVIPIHTAH